MDDSKQDPVALFPEFSRISISQQDLLRSTALVGDTSPNNTPPSQFEAEAIPVSSAPVVVLSPPDTIQDVFLTPPEDESLLPSSDDDVPHCTVNQPVDVDDESQVFVDLAGVSQLGFPENSQRVDGGGLVDESRVSERDISELGQVPVKKLKLGFDSTTNSKEKFENAVECEQVNDEDLKRETPMVEKVSENVEMQNAEVVEGSGVPEHPVLRLLRKELESGKYKGEDKSFLFEALKMLSDNSKGDEVDDDDDDDDDNDGLTVLEAAKLSGMTCPRPSWWLDHCVSKYFNFDDDDQVEK